MSLFVDPEWIRNQPLTPMEKRAWEIYCRDTSRGLDVRDHWSELPHQVRELYLKKATLELQD